MRTIRLGLGIAAALAVAACGSNERAATTAVDGDLQRDLSLAEASQTGSLTLPGTERERTQVVSAVELLPRAAEVPTRASPRPRATRPARVKVRAVRRDVTPAPAPAPEPVVDVAAVEPLPTPEPTPAVEIAPALEPVIENPRPVAIPVDDPGPRGRGPRDRGGWGGVVIRGGGVDGDHCERDHPRRRGGGGMISINVIGPVGQTTFPRY